MTDPLDEIRARRAGMPVDPLEVTVTPTEEEYYMQWRIIEHGPPDEYGDRDRLAFVPEEEAEVAEFIAHAPADIDWLIGEVERLREVEERLHGAQVTIGKLSHKVERLRGLLGRLEWAGICREDDACPACHSWKRVHYPDCWLAAELATRPTSPDPPEGSQP
jgi:hypothetical protein